MLTNLNAAEKKVAMKAIKRNAYSAYNDQLVLSMFADEDDAVKRKAVVLFRQLREKQQLEDESKEELESEYDDEGLSDVD